MNEKSLIILGVILLMVLYYIRRKEQYEEPSKESFVPTLEENPALDRLKRQFTDCQGDAECVRKVMVETVRSGQAKKIVAPINASS
jgi:hypothetical protein